MALFSRNSFTEAQILDALRTVNEPELGGDLVSRKMIQNVVITGDKVSFAIELTTPACPLKHEIRTSCEEALTSIAGVVVASNGSRPASMR